MKSFPLTLSVAALLAAVAFATLVEIALPVAAAAEGRGRRPTFAELDADGDGVVTSDEFLTPPSEHFAALDADADGVLTEEELEAGRPSRPARRGGAG